MTENVKGEYILNSNRNSMKEEEAKKNFDAALDSYVKLKVSKDKNVNSSQKFFETHMSGFSSSTRPSTVFSNGRINLMKKN